MQHMYTYIYNPEVGMLKGNIQATHFFLSFFDFRSWACDWHPNPEFEEQWEMDMESIFGWFASQKFSG